ncbi:MAG: hypothetical protein WD431_18295 [Cyclobacteriaceae bacterium]
MIWNTERILFPERGARLGKFGVTAVSPDEAWVTVSEWVQPKEVEKYGSDGSIYLAKIHCNSCKHSVKSSPSGAAEQALGQILDTGFGFFL